ncbi:Universal stress protein family protein [Brevibacterium sp. 239c]|uniref:universal stress protein n=1 Tax=Brevibacterium sp. 239c TaxID=1965356 RepID=UPI000C5B6A5E|nr:universal stress protein [Brevibacterium sp. 239c]SMX67847.1 Universal stress protein family protein [Brevibacterium sp. 239c]
MDITVEVEVDVGEPPLLIAAKTRTSALTVIGTQGSGAVPSALLDSVSLGVLNNAECPVLVAPAEAKHDDTER